METFPALELRNNGRLGLLTTAISLAVLALGIFDDGFSKLLLLWLGGVGTVAGLWVLLDRRVKLRLDEIGIRYARWGPSYVQWDEIEAVETRTFRGVEQLSIVPRDPASVLARMPPLSRWQSRLAKAAWSSRFVISTSALEVGTEAVRAAASRYHRLRTGGS